MIYSRDILILLAMKVSVHLNRCSMIDYPYACLMQCSWISVSINLLGKLASWCVFIAQCVSRFEFYHVICSECSVVLFLYVSFWHVDSPHWGYDEGSKYLLKYQGVEHRSVKSLAHWATQQTANLTSVCPLGSLQHKPVSWVNCARQTW